MIQLHKSSLNRKRIKVANKENHILKKLNRLETIEKNRILTASKSGNDQNNKSYGYNEPNSLNLTRSSKKVLSAMVASFEPNGIIARNFQLGGISHSFAASASGSGL